MTISHKAISAARQMKEDIVLRSGLAVVDSFDGSGNPVLTVGTATSTNQGCTIRIKMADTVQVDGLGLTQRVFTPHIVQLIVEESGTANVGVLTSVNLSKILAELLKHAMRVDIHLVINGENPTLASASFVAGTDKTTTIDHLWHPLTSSM